MRLFRIDQMIHDRGPVSFEEMRQALRCSSPTLKRDIRYLREELNAPIVYSYKDNGYVYSQEPGSEGKRVVSYDLPATWYSPTEMYVLLTALRLFDKVEGERDGLLSGEMRAMKSRLLSLVRDDKIPPRELQKRIKVVLPELNVSRNPFFEVIGSALAERKRLRIVYYTKARKTENLREVSPMRLVNYKSRWYMDAWCHQTEALKTFNLSYISSAELLDKACKSVSMREVEQRLDSTYGLFSGDMIRIAVIEIDDVLGAYVKDEIWHKDQVMKIRENGSLELQVPYAHEAELAGQILRLGSHARVKAPASLRRHMREELLTTLNQYTLGLEGEL